MTRLLPALVAAVVIALGAAASMGASTSSVGATTPGGSPRTGVEMGASGGEADVSFSLPDDPGAVVLRMQHGMGMVRDGSGPEITLFAGGRVLVEFPPYMKRAGRYELQLPPGELHERMRGWLRKGVAEFDSDRVRRARRDARTVSGHRAEVLDAGTTRLDLRLPSYRGRGRGAEAANAAPLAKQIRWRALHFDARHYPELVEVKALAEVCEELDALMRSPALVELP